MTARSTLIVESVKHHSVPTDTEMNVDYIKPEKDATKQPAAHFCTGFTLPPCRQMFQNL